MLVRSRAIVHNKYARLWLSTVRAGRKQLQRYSFMLLLSNSLQVIGNPEFRNLSLSTWSIRRALGRFAPVASEALLTAKLAATLGTLGSRRRHR